MKTSDQIIIEELKRIVLMQSQEITRLITKINVLERELSGYTTKKAVTIALCHLLKMRTGLHAQAVFGRKGIVKQVDNLDMRGKHWR